MKYGKYTQWLKIERCSCGKGEFVIRTIHEKFVGIVKQEVAGKNCEKCGKKKIELKDLENKSGSLCVKKQMTRKSFFREVIQEKKAQRNHLLNI